MSGWPERGSRRCESHCCPTAASPTAAARASTSATSAVSWPTSGHEVEVFSGQPYPELDPGVRLTKVPSLDLYREPDPFRVPEAPRVPRPDRRRGVRSPCARPASRSRRRSARGSPGCCADRVDDFDIVHDNQVLGYGMLDIEKHRAAADHHAAPPDHLRPPDRPRQTPRPVAPKLTLRRWYGFLRMQGKVARQARQILTPSEASTPRHRQGLRRRPGPDAGDPARRRRRVRAADQAAGARAGSWRWPAPTPR